MRKSWVPVQRHQGIHSSCCWTWVCPSMQRTTLWLSHWMDFWRRQSYTSSFKCGRSCCLTARTAHTDERHAGTKRDGDSFGLMFGATPGVQQPFESKIPNCDSCPRSSDGAGCPLGTVGRSPSGQTQSIGTSRTTRNHCVDLARLQRSLFFERHGLVPACKTLRL